MTQKVIAVILGVIIIGGLAWYFNQNYLQSSNKTGETQGFSNSPGTKSTEEVSGNLVYAIFSDNREIWMANSAGQKKKLFTDVDETDKIVKLSNLATLSKEVLAVVSADKNASSGKLVAINLDNAKVEVLQPSFSASADFSVSLDGKDLAYIKFSNVEANYGYTLYSQKRTGFNIRELKRSESEIRLPVWDKSGGKVAFIQVNGVDSELMVVDKESGEESSIAGFSNKTVDWLSWGESEKIVLSLRKIGENSSSEIILVDAQTKKDQKFTDVSGGVTSFIYSNNLWLSYLVGQYQEKTNNLSSGQIYFQNILNKEKIPFQKGNQILGWLS